MEGLSNRFAISNFKPLSEYDKPCDLTSLKCCDCRLKSSLKDDARAGLGEHVAFSGLQEEAKHVAINAAVAKVPDTLIF